VSRSGIALTAWLALISTALAYVLFVRGLRAIPASIAGTLSRAEPLVASPLAVLVLGERLAPHVNRGTVDTVLDKLRAHP
jgi:DME family drug/metabolite transporter